ncbi:hypothetical protein MmiEs2_11350 [Methanimicrococcus stummii]|uniref:Uncharacterized protein n=1 Tax=Methanimicrococcus stummii TaxID=3028294 RepID=A0AA96VMM3_9EURY|nr:hypothetical protein [Methanimicrococcus sp. Es2]WNY28922.1 hypothetical protein MmiEs2_11350 [Methanimicrococcus sp. Es2]
MIEENQKFICIKKAYAEEYDNNDMKTGRIVNTPIGSMWAKSESYVKPFKKGNIRLYMIGHEEQWFEIPESTLEECFKSIK